MRVYTGTEAPETFQFQFSSNFSQILTKAIFTNCKQINRTLSQVTCINHFNHNVSLFRLSFLKNLSNLHVVRVYE